MWEACRNWKGNGVLQEQIWYGHVQTLCQRADCLPCWLLLIFPRSAWHPPCLTWASCATVSMGSRCQCGSLASVLMYTCVHVCVPCEQMKGVMKRDFLALGAKGSITSSQYS